MLRLTKQTLAKARNSDFTCFFIHDLRDFQNNTGLKREKNIVKAFSMFMPQLKLQNSMAIDKSDKF